MNLATPRLPGVAGAATGGTGPGLDLGSGPAGRRRRRDGRWALWLLPMVAATMLLTVYPATEAVRLSAFDWDGFGDKTWVGLENYERMLTDRVARKALWNTAFF